jgi:hypothetical protein
MHRRHESQIMPDDLIAQTAQIIFERDVDSFLRDMVDDDGLAW